MEGQTVYEVIGYTASALVVTSLLMSSLLKLRLVNVVGASVFAVYGLLIGALPVMLTNGAIILIDVYYLVVLLRARAADAYFEVVKVAPDSPVLRRFVEFHLDDIRQFQPSFAGLSDDHLAWMVLRNAVPVGAVLASREASDAEVAQLDLDYVSPPHRDFTAGRVLFGEAGTFGSRGIRRVVTAAETTVHRRYLSRMGFTGSNGSWSREVP